MANIVGINFESIVDGAGVRVVVFFAGCHHHCKGCHNPESHRFDVGRPFSEEIQNQIMEYIRETPYIDGVTLSGGDPMYSAKDIKVFVERLKESLPEATVWLYSGFTYEEIVADPDMKSLLALCDVLVDGPFVIEQRDVSLCYRGSRNQRIISVVDSLSSGEPVLLEQGKCMNRSLSKEHLWRIDQ